MNNKQDVQDMINDMFNAYKNSYKAKDDGRIEIACKKKEFEDTLNKMWKIYINGNINQLSHYQKQLNEIKNCGCKVMRNSKGEHKIII